MLFAKTTYVPVRNTELLCNERQRRAAFNGDPHCAVVGMARSSHHRIRPIASRAAASAPSSARMSL